MLRFHPWLAALCLVSVFQFAPSSPADGAQLTLEPAERSFVYKGGRGALKLLFEGEPREAVSLTVVAPPGVAINARDAARSYTLDRQGRRSAVLRYKVSRFEDSRPDPRTLTATVNGVPFTVTQTGGAPCKLSLSAVKTAVPATESMHSFDVRTPAACPWQATADQADWLAVSPSSGEGAAGVEVVVQANATGKPRRGRISVAPAGHFPKKFHQISQRGVRLPPPPAHLVAIAGNGEVRLNWDAAKGAVSYNLYYGASAGLTKTTATRLPGVSNPYTVQGLTAGETYTFAVAAAGAAGEGKLSAEASAVPDSLAVADAPFRLPLSVKETAGIARDGELVHNGIPLPRDLGLKDVAAAHLEDGSGQGVDAQFEVLSRWGGGVADASKPIQWLLVTFPAQADAGGATGYALVSGARSNTGPTLAVQEDDAGVTLDTGAARFRIGRTAFSVFDAVSLSTSPDSLIAGGGMGGGATIQVDDQEPMTALPPQEVTVEHQGELFVTVKLAGVLSNPPYAGKDWNYVARYAFFAGSPTAQLDFYYAFPWNRDGNQDIWMSGPEDRVTVNRVRLTLPVAPGSGVQAYAAAAMGSTEAGGALAPGNAASLAQRLRPAMTAPAAYDLALGDALQQGGFATAPYVALWGTAGGMGASLQQMRFYEPQAVRAYDDRLEIDVVAERQPLGPFMGAYAKMAFSVGGNETVLKAAGARALAQLDHGLVVWPERREVARSGLLDELWDGSPSADGTRYWDLISAISANTRTGYTTYGMHGFMTYGLVPRYWSLAPEYGLEFGDTGVWDGYFSGGTFTDYHNAFGNVVRQFAQSGDPELLHGLAFPAARRTLNTQIVQGDPSFFFAGWSPIGYGGYRSDFNSSHSYFDNLFAYYYLTGDRRVIDVLQPAGENLRNAYSRDAGGTLIPPEQPPRNDWMGTLDRVGSQHAAIYWFLGHASPDASFLDDFRNNLARGFERHTALLTRDGKEYAFSWEKPSDMEPGWAQSTQMWMWSLYYLQNAWCLYREFGDLPLGPGRLTISRYFAGVNRTLWDYSARVHPTGDGTPAGDWATALEVRWEGPAKGGTLTGVTWVAQDEPMLWFSGKSALPGFMFRAARLSQDPEAWERAASLTRYLLQNGTAENQVWGKETALRFIRMHGAIGYLTGGLNAGQ
jgi:hypothetical protein